MPSCSSTATIPPRGRFDVRVERERDGEGWLIRTHNREYGWLHGAFDAALHDARKLAVALNVCVTSGAGVTP